MLKIFESKSNKKFEIVFMSVMLLSGILLLFFKGYFLGTFICVISLVGGIILIRGFNKNDLVVEISDNGITLPYKGNKLFFKYEDIVKIERKDLPFFPDDISGPSIALFLKSEKKPLIISLPILDVEEGEVIKIINREIKKRLSNA